MRSTTRMIALASGVSILALIGACEDRSNTSTTTTPAPSTRTTTPATTSSAPTTPPAAVPANTTTPDADNTKRNERDRDGNTVTPLDQAENEADRTITAEIRKAIVGEKGMSMNAQNVKIITRSGVVTLRGPVDSTAEKDAVEAKAKGVAGVTSVVSELEVKAAKP